ncbi:MAG TPA: type 1 glutamine amidotransferase [Gaiellaceae bacterium]|nr:type 1 glutamine amidotransferase [Gaiellaceae bacterium]
MNVLSVVHSDHAGTGLFASAVADAGHHLDEWSFSWSTAPPRPLDSYDAVLVFGGAMHADQDAWHPWLGAEASWLQGLLERGTPTLGICLGVQMLARASGSWVGPLPAPEIGWHEVELTGEGRADPVVGSLPERFDAFQWHHYTHGVPDGATVLARNPTAVQAVRFREACWGVQFHPEVTESQVLGWIADKDDPPPDPDGLVREVAEKMGRWNELGRALCGSFLEAAERLLARAA